VEDKNNPTPHELLLVGQLIAQLRAALESNANWGHIKWFLDALSGYRPKKTLAEIAHVANFHRSELTKRYYDDEKFLGVSDRDNLKRWLGIQEGVLNKNLEGVVLKVPETHIRLNELKAGARSFLEYGEWNTLEPLEQQGLDEVTSCLLCGNYTSAEFMALRTVESLLRRWYEGKTDSKLERESWGEILEQLNDLYPKPQRPKELSLLDYLRERRNEIAHPEALPSEEEATATFLNVIKVCKTITRELLK